MYMTHPFLYVWLDVWLGRAMISSNTVYRETLTKGKFDEFDES